MTRNNTFCIIGMSTFGLSLAKQFSKLGSEVIVIDKDQEVTNRLNNKFDTAVTADATNIEALKSLAVQDMNTVIVAVREFETSIYICTNLRELKVPNIIAYAKSNIQMKILKNLGVSTVITPEINSANSLALQLSNHIDVQDDFIGAGFSLIKVFMNKYEEGILMTEINNKLDFIDIFSVKRGNRIISARMVQKVEMGDILYIACESKKIPTILQFFYKNLEN